MPEAHTFYFIGIITLFLRWVSAWFWAQDIKLIGSEKRPQWSSVPGVLCCSPWLAACTVSRRRHIQWGSVPRLARLLSQRPAPPGMRSRQKSGTRFAFGIAMAEQSSILLCNSTVRHSRQACAAIMATPAVDAPVSASLRAEPVCAVPHMCLLV